MFFEKEILSFNVLDVYEINQENVNVYNSGRNFNAISYRYDANTVLTTKNQKHIVGSEYVCFVPARLDYNRTAKRDNLIVVHFDLSGYSTQNIECFKAKKPELFAELFKKILSLWNIKDTGYKYKSSAILYEIFAECYKQNYKQINSESKIKKSVEYMLKNFKNASLTIGEIAKQSFISEVYFRKIFKKEYGISPQKHIINLRIENAVELISTGYYSLKEVAFMSGYSDYKYFSVEFKKAKGISPSQYVYNFNDKMIVK